MRGRPGNRAPGRVPRIRSRMPCGGSQAIRPYGASSTIGRLRSHPIAITAIFPGGGGPARDERVSCR